ncbi:MAG: Helicase-associated protein, partial [uncultured bacterium (gcode 4)]
DRWVPELHIEPVSKADSNQRAWRTWRVDDWEYVRTCDVDYDAIPDFPKGEIENITLEKNILIALSIWFNPLKNIKAWRNPFVHKPDMILLKMTYDNLYKIWAINKNHEVTILWNEMLNLPLEPNVWRMLIESLTRKCSWDMIDICAIINHKWFLSRWQDWKYLVKWTYKQDSDLIAQKELLNILTRREPLDQELLWKLKSKNYWLSHQELNLFQEFAHHWQEKMLFEVVDFSSMWIKQKRIYEILSTINSLTERLKESGKLIEYNVDEVKRLESVWKLAKNQSKYENIIISILSWMLNNIFVYNKKSKKLFNEKKWGFDATDTSSIPLSEKAYYCWSPFILKWSKEDENGEDESVKKENDMYLLSFITKISDEMLLKIGKNLITSNMSNVEVVNKVIWKTKRWKDKFEQTLFVNLQRELWWVTLPDFKKEIQMLGPKDFREEEFIAVILIEKNRHFKEYIAKYDRNLFDIDRFRYLVSLFTWNLKHRVHLGNLEQTIAWFAEDKVIYDNFFKSTIPKVADFIENPFKKDYKQPKAKPNTTDKKATKIKKKIKTSQPSKNTAWKINIIDYLRTKYRKDKILQFLEKWVVIEKGIKLDKDSFVDPKITDVKIDFKELKIITAVQKAEENKWDVLSYDEAQEIRFAFESKVKPKKEKETKPKKEKLLISKPDKDAEVKRVMPVTEKLPKTSLRHTWEKKSRKVRKLDTWEIKIQLQKYLSSKNILTTALVKKYIAFEAIIINWELARIWMEINPDTDTIDIDHNKFKEADSRKKALKYQ